MKKIRDYIHRYRGYWSDGGRCRIRIYREDGRAPVEATPGRARPVPYGPDTYCIPVEANLRALQALYTALREAASWGT